MLGQMVMSNFLEGPQWIQIKGYKSLGEAARLELRPLTLLAGTNSSGKSSVLQPLLLLKQSLEAHFEPDPLELNGAHVSFTSLSQFLSRGRTKTSQARSFEIIFGLPVEGSDDGLRVERRLLFRRSREQLDVQTFVRQEHKKKWTELDLEPDVLGWADGEPKTAEVLSVFGATKMAPAGSKLWRSLYILFHDEKFSDWGNDTRKWVESILHLPGHRGHRDRRYPITRVRKGEAGSFSVTGPMPPYAANLLSEWNDGRKKDATAKSRDKKRIDFVNDGMQQLGLTWKAVARQANAAELDLRVGRLPHPQSGGAQDLVDIADAGFGVSQVLPVLVALAGAVPGQLVLIEQPELHLHPRAQLAMGRILANAANRGVIVVVETHSQLLLRAIQTVVAKGELSPDQVGLHWFARDQKTGWSTIELAELHSDGTFGDWPVDFPDVFAMADQDFIDAVFDASVE